MSVKQNFAHIKENIKRASISISRNAEEIHIIAVTKYVSIQRAKEAVDAGVQHLGENRDEGFLQKWDELKDTVSWHYIGTLQSRKVKNVVDKIDYLHSLDRVSLAEEIEKRANKVINCFIQVNTSEEKSKHGIQRSEVLPFIKQLEQFKKIKVVGLMTMAPFTDNEEIVRDCFRELRNLQQKVQSLHLEHAPCKELSMGMSNDYIIAVEEGATFIRIGSALVGNE
ncbi:MULTISPECIES: YggS family pyridoxal phosphate-dependent enzyme [Bacillus]|uniref:YggS family pyridoxal phosphate-dependent enzyme n=1 Tax=Bacillus TaxID=1386 RepID=UPI000BB6909D|nr:MULTISPECIES: YggS family pyridoxal phosphate-dependent enzyme [Bacillus]